MVGLARRILRSDPPRSPAGRAGRARVSEPRVRAVRAGAGAAVQARASRRHGGAAGGHGGSRDRRGAALRARARGAGPPGPVVHRGHAARRCRRGSPDVELVLLVGADAAGELSSWREAAEIPRLARVAAFARPGAPLPRSPAIWRTVAVPAIDISATEVRERVRGGSLDPMARAGCGRPLRRRRAAILGRSMMIKQMMTAVFGTRFERERKRLQPIVEEIKGHEARLGRSERSRAQGPDAAIQGPARRAHGCAQGRAGVGARREARLPRSGASGSGWRPGSTSWSSDGRRSWPPRSTTCCPRPTPRCARPAAACSAPR